MDLIEYYLKHCSIYIGSIVKVKNIDDGPTYTVIGIFDSISCHIQDVSSRLYIMPIKDLELISDIEVLKQCAL